ncbi:MAG: hypothetical protein F9K46_09990 [Anaerolineae bacterium]|nr:MAG: hypothetical protein F9K46_09990 [Anaerolineae bacterium]
MNDFPFDDNDIDLFATESLVEEEDFDFPIDESGTGMSRQFLIGSAVLVITIVLGVCGIVLALRQNQPMPIAERTKFPLTNEAILTAIAATQTRLPLVAGTETAVTERLNRNATNTAIAQASGTASAVNHLLDGSRTAIGFPTISPYQETEQASYIQSKTAERPSVMQVQILDFDGNPVTSITIHIYQDDGDGEFDLLSPTSTKAG